MNIMYLTWGETPRSYGVFGSQVVQQFIRNALQKKDCNYSFVAGVPVINSSLLREGRSYYKQIKRLKQMLDNIPFLRVPIFCPQNFVFSNRYTFGPMHWIAHIGLAKKIKMLKPDIVHARSYHATYAAIEVKRKYKLDYKIIFDARGLWPEEIAWKRSYSATDKNYIFLKKIEKRLLLESDVCVCVSETMEEALRPLYDSETELIYLSADTKLLAEAVGRRRVECENGMPIIKLCYLGAISEQTWHSAGQLAALYAHIECLGLNVSLKIITTSNHDNLRKRMPNIPSDKLEIISTASPNQLKEALGDVNIGVLPYRSNERPFEALVGNSILGTKTAEYLSAGLPVLVNENCGGAARIVEKYGVGICYASEDFEKITKNALCKVLEIDDIKFKQLSKYLFDYDANAKRYQNLYQRLYKK